MDSHRCEIVLVQNSADASGYPCGKDAEEACCDCGTSLCELHADCCEICNQVFCDFCLYRHALQPHARPAASISIKEDRRRSA